MPAGRADQAVVVAWLLSISGEDSITVDRKHFAPWTGTLPTRFLVLTNELPRLCDASGALAGRFIVLCRNRSWYGRNDLSLTDRLRAELPGILNWSIEGWRRLRAPGHFVRAYLDRIELDPKARRGVLWLPGDAMACRRRETASKSGAHLDQFASNRLRSHHHPPIATLDLDAVHAFAHLVHCGHCAPGPREDRSSTPGTGLRRRRSSARGPHSTSEAGP
jgi:hypothetical protein